MVASKSQPNKMDSEPIIDMGPVYQEKKLKIIIYISLFLSFLVTIISLSFFYWVIEFYIPNQLNSKSSNLEKVIDQIQNNSKLLGKDIAKIRQKSIDLSNKLANVDIQNNNNTTKIDLDNINKVIFSLENQIELISNKITKIEENKKLYKGNVTSNLIVKNNKSYQSNLKSNNKLKTKEKLLIVELKSIIGNLLKRKDLGLVLNKKDILDETNYLDQIKQYLAGSFKLRQFTEEMSPRSLITKAEKEMDNGNIQEAINLLRQLPESWKISINEFILRADQILNKKILGE
ncbi:hypothetical protein OAE14_01100 [Alphaproteobacteria bacterium]|nr:hypothetical protein [Alphaproteobacteria bacterium]